MIPRLIIDLVIAISILNGWWFVAVPLAIVATWRLPYFIEVIIAGIAYDALFGFIPALGIWAYSGTISALIIVTVVYILKKVVR